MENIYNDYIIHPNGEIFRKDIIIKAKRKHGLVNYKLKGKQIKITKNKSGYMVFGVGGRKGKSVYLHRLLAKTFIPNPENKPYVNHIDNDPSNNRLDNLEWCSQRENIHHAMKQGRIDKAETKVDYKGSVIVLPVQRDDNGMAKIVKDEKADTTPEASPGITEQATGIIQEEKQIIGGIILPPLN